MSYEGEVVLNYRFGAKLGEGGFGAVYVAEHVALGRRVAIKVLHRQYALDPTVVERFFREARAVCDIGHRAIVAIENFGTLPGGEPFYVMELFPGESLTVAARVRRFGPTQVVAIFDPIAEALSAAHAKGIIHRDLKPDNIMVRFDGEIVTDVRLLDFGIAKLLDGGTTSDGVASMTGGAMGTPNFMAPEQALDAKHVDARADVYSFAATVFAAVAAQPPFVGPTVVEIMIRVQTEVAPRLRALVPEVPADLDASIARCLSKSRDDRPASIAEAWAAMRAAVLGSPQLVVGGGRITRPGRVPVQVLTPSPMPGAGPTPLPATLATGVGSAPVLAGDAASAPAVVRSLAADTVPPSAGGARRRSRTVVLAAAALLVAGAIVVGVVVATQHARVTVPAPVPMTIDAASGPGKLERDAATVTPVGSDAAVADDAVVVVIDARPAPVDAMAPVAPHDAPVVRAAADARAATSPPDAAVATPSACSPAALEAAANAATADTVRAVMGRVDGCRGSLDGATYARIRKAALDASVRN